MIHINTCRLMFYFYKLNALDNLENNAKVLLVMSEILFAFNTYTHSAGQRLAYTHILM